MFTAVGAGAVAGSRGLGRLTIHLMTTACVTRWHQQWWLVLQLISRLSSLTAAEEQQLALSGTTVTVSSVFSSGVPDRLYDGDTGTYWHSTNVLSWPEWILVDVGAGQELAVTQYSIRSRAVGPVHWQYDSPVDFELQASNISSGAWTTLHNVSSLIWSQGGQIAEFIVPPASRRNCRYYRLSFTAIRQPRSNGDKFVVLSELQLHYGG